jgi:hypothetical protein
VIIVLNTIVRLVGRIEIRRSELRRRMIVIVNLDNLVYKKQYDFNFKRRVVRGVDREENKPNMKKVRNEESLDYLSIFS